MKLVFTICSGNYLAQAIILGHSLREHNPHLTFIIGLVDKKPDIIDPISCPFEILEVDILGIPGFDEMILRYNIVELNTAVKPFFFNYFLKKYNPEFLIYLDPDIQVFARFTDLEFNLENYDIIITPHLKTPLNDNEWQAEEDFLNSGLYNLGFIAIRNNENTGKMIDWWAERLKTKAFIDFKRGLFTDQIWINFVPLFFKNVLIFTHPGYNVAYWNLHERVISEKNGEYFVNADFPLVFYHYASYRPHNPEAISLHQTRFNFKNRPDIEPLFTNYRELLFRAGYEELNRTRCFYVIKKEEYDRMIYFRKLKKYPAYKKFLGKLARFLVNRFHLVLDYRDL